MAQTTGLEARARAIYHKPVSTYIEDGGDPTPYLLAPFNIAIDWAVTTLGKAAIRFLLSEGSSTQTPTVSIVQLSGPYQASAKGREPMGGPLPYHPLMVVPPGSQLIGLSEWLMGPMACMLSGKPFTGTSLLTGWTP